MSPGDLGRFAGGALVGHRLRAALSVTGVAVGISAVIALTALGEGARRYVTQEFLSLGSNLVILVPGKISTTGVMPYGGVTRDMTIEDYEAIATRLPRVRRAAPVSVGNETLRFEERNRAAPILGTTVDFLEVRHMKVAAGTFLPARPAEEGGNEMVLGPKVAQELFGFESPLGQVVRMGDWRFRVVGVLAPRGRTMGFDLDSVVFIPVRTAMRAFDRTGLFRILMEVRSRGDMQAAKEDVLALMKERHRAEDVTVVTQDAVLETFSSILNALTLALAGIASVSLVVAGVGIMNVMLVSVTERRPEIGLLKAMGATNGQILTAFLAEALMLSAVGGAAGLLIGWASVHVFTRIYPEFPASPPAWAVAAALTLSVLVGVVFGLWPAYRASRLDPVLSLQKR